MYLKTLRLINYIELCSQVLQGQGKSKIKTRRSLQNHQILSPEVFPVLRKKKKKKKEHLQNAQRIGSVKLRMS